MNKTVIVTGASRGIGKAIATVFAQNGYNVVINYNKSEEQAKALESSLSEYNVCIFKADVSDPDSAASLCDFALSRFGKIDVLVNNAGIAKQSLITDVSFEEWSRIFNVNVGSCFNCSKSVLPHMINRKSGLIINISSIWGICGASCEVAYSASKAAIIGFTKALAKEVGPSGITVNCIAPGVIDTEMNSNLSSDDLAALCDETPLCRIGSCDDIAQTALFLASQGASFITGQVISPNGGIVI